MTSCGSAEFKLRWAFRFLFMLIMIIILIMLIIMMIMIIMLMMMVRWSWSSCWSWSCLQWTWVIRWWGILWLSWICAHWALLRLFDADESGNIELDEMFEIVATFYDMEVRQITQGDGTISILMLFIKVKIFHHKEMMRFYMGESWDLSDRTNLLAVLSP